MNTDTKVTVAFLELVDSPVSNSDAVRLSGIPESGGHLRDSDFYIIGGRAAAKFENPSTDTAGNVISFDIRVADTVGSGSLVIDDLPELEDFEGQISIQLGPDAIVVLNADKSVAPESRLLSVYSPDSFLFWSSRGRAGLHRPNNARELSTFDLLYAGIAKVGDSYSRLIERGHKQRMEILGAELQREPGARVADETYLFFFRVDPLIMRSFGLETDFDKVQMDMTIESKRWVADAEKAMVSLLKPKYNRTLYSSYPSGTDGLVGQGFARYGYSIAEDIAFRTAQGTMRGARRGETQLSNGADFIFVEGNDVSLKLSGVDFDSSDMP